MYIFDQTILDSKSIDHLDITNKNVLIRSCLNVTMDSGGKITDDTRLSESLPTLEVLGQKAKRVIIMAHLGRPTKAREPEFSLEPIRQVLEIKLGKRVIMLSDEAALSRLSNGTEEESVFYLIENIRYFEGEETKDEVIKANFAQQLSALGEIFINDAFADYREAVSTYEIAKLIPSYAGPVFQKEVKAISYFTSPQKPFVAILGGAKLSEKLDAMLALCQLADQVIVGGAMAYTIMQSMGIRVGKSLVEHDKLDVAAQIVTEFSSKLVLPIDHIVAPELSPETITNVTGDSNIPDDLLAIDIGPRTQEAFTNVISAAKSILWNGPMGVFEWENGITGTEKIATAIINNNQSYKFAGGGDTIAAINKLKLTGFNHISTGGGAMLAYIAYDKFPTLDVILNS